MEISAPWQYDNEGEALQFIVRDGQEQRRIKLNRRANAALCDFLVQRVRRERPEVEQST
jgi:hypothetical protein